MSITLTTHRKLLNNAGTHEVPVWLESPELLGSHKSPCVSVSTRTRNIALVTDPADAADISKHVVVEVTPRSRRLYHLPSTATLQKQILHKRVMITGWLFYDSIHTSNAANTNPNGKSIWRATCEEIHPVVESKFFISDRHRARSQDQSNRRKRLPQYAVWEIHSVMALRVNPPHWNQ